MPLARLQSHLAGHGGDPLGLQSHGDPGWVLCLCLWWWSICFTRTVVVLGWFSGAVLENRMGLSSARHWGTPWVPVWGSHPSPAANWEPVVCMGGGVGGCEPPAPGELAVSVCLRRALPFLGDTPQGK